MGTGKELKFSFAVDESSFAKVKRALAELTTEAQKFAKSLQGTGGFFGGGSVGRTGQGGQPGQGGGQRASATTSISSAILKDVEAFKSLAKQGGDTMNIMTAAIKKSISDQTAEIGRLDAMIGRLAGKYKDLSAAEQTAAQKQMLRLGGLRAGVQERLNETVEAARTGIPGMYPGPREDMPPGAPKGNWWYQPGAGGAPPSFFGGAIQGIMPPGIGGVMRVGGLALGGANLALNEVMAGTRAYSSQEAIRSNLVNSDIRRLRGGDISGIMAMGQLMRDSQRRQDLRDQTGTAASIEAGRDAVGGFVSRVAGAASFGMFGSTSGMLGEGFTTASRESKMGGNALQQARDYENSTAFLPTKMALERFQGELQSRISMGRILGVGISRDKITKENVDTYGDLNSRLTAQGYDMGQYASAVQQARLSGGRQFASRRAGAIMAANAAGYGEYGGMLAQAERVGGNANMALGGRIDTAAGIQLGQQMFQYNARGQTTGEGLLAAIQAGMNFTGGPQDFNLVQRAGLGANLLSNITTGGMDAYQQGRNLLSAIGTNPGGSTYAQDFLGNGMDIKQMVDMAGGGRLTATARALGLDQNMIKQQLGGSVSSVLDRFVDQGAGDPMSKAIRGFRSSGMALPDYLKTLKGKKGGAEQIEAIGAFFGMESGMGEEAGLGAVQTLSGIGAKGKIGKGPAGKVGEVELEAVKQQAKVILDDATELAKGAEAMKTAFKLTPEATNMMKNFGENLSASAEQYIKALGNLAAATNATAYRMSGGAVGEPLPASNSRKAVVKVPASHGGAGSSGVAKD